MEHHHRKWLIATTGITDVRVAELGHQEFKTPYPVLCGIAGTPTIKEQLRTKRLQLAGRIARASPHHPLRQLPADDWDRTIEEDLEELRATGDRRFSRICKGTLSDKFHCKRMTERDNPHTYFNNH